MIQLMDCTLRDGANIFGHGFPEDLTVQILEGLIQSNISIIEMGNCGGLGAYALGKDKAETDETYLKIAKKYAAKAETGMFLHARRYQKASVELAAKYQLAFLRVGIEAGDAGLAVTPIQEIKKAGLKAYFASMKAYLLPPKDLAEEARRLEASGLDLFVMMDSAGTLTPSQVARYIETLAGSVSIPIGFHGHNNLALANANALAAWQSGAQVLDCSLMGMARSAGNAATEAITGLLQREGMLTEINFYQLLDLVDEIRSAMEQRYSYRCSLPPLDLILGISGAHSGFLDRFHSAANSEQVNLYRLIAESSRKNRKNPDEDLIRAVAGEIKRKAETA